MRDHAAKRIFLGIENHDSIGDAVQFCEGRRSPVVRREFGQRQRRQSYEDFATRRRLPSTWLKTDYAWPAKKLLPMPRLMAILKRRYQGYVAVEFEAAGIPTKRCHHS